MMAFGCIACSTPVASSTTSSRRRACTSAGSPAREDGPARRREPGACSHCLLARRAEGLQRRSAAVDRGRRRQAAASRAGIPHEGARATYRAHQGLLATQGVYDFQPNRRDWESRLSKIVTGDGRPLPPRLALEIDRHCQRLTMVNAMLALLLKGQNGIGKPAA